VDEQIGKIYEALEKKGVLNNTILIFTSDHGDMQSDHWLWRKGYPYEGSTHIPFIMSWGDEIGEKLGVKMKKGSRYDEMVELRDVFPTFYDAAGGDLKDPKYDFDGVSLIDVLRDPSHVTRDYLDLGLDVNYPDSNLTLNWNGIFTKKYKYAYFARY